MKRIGHSFLICAMVALLSSLMITPMAHAQKDHFGVRIGGSANSGSEQFTVGEIYLRHALPWTWRPSTHWRLTTHLEGGAAVLDGRGNTGAALSVGPVGVWDRDGARWRFEIGIKPTVLSEDRYGSRDLGGHFHFTSHLGIRYQLHPRFSVGYRVQHISNAGISSPNPGLDLHLLTLDRSTR
ncbi:MAG: acyloxyacyl hydrolase [Thioalkalivibrio sp.]|nr:acyloxyacyl hydrolase [Thioalkalivibrio sp.]